MRIAIKLIYMFLLSVSLILSQTDNPNEDRKSSYQNNSYTLNVKISNNEIKKYENVYFIEQTLFTYVFKNQLETFEVRRKNIISIYDSNNNSISVNELAQFKMNNFNNNSKNSNQENLYSAGQHLKNFTSYYFGGLLISCIGIGIWLDGLSEEEDNIGSALSIIGLMMTLYAIFQVGEAGDDLQNIQIKE